MYLAIFTVNSNYAKGTITYWLMQMFILCCLRVEIHIVYVPWISLKNAVRMRE